MEKNDLLIKKVNIVISINMANFERFLKSNSLHLLLSIIY